MTSHFILSNNEKAVTAYSSDHNVTVKSLSV